MSYNEYVGVAVLSYNSEKTIIETLESIKRQTYRYLDLYINDDCSSDKTVDLVNVWLRNNKNRFRKISLRTHSINQGINKSFDFILRQCETKWVKFIAADDLLMETCIEDNINYVITNKIETLLYSYYHSFIEVNSKKITLKEDSFERHYLDKMGTYNPYKQYRLLLKKDIVFSPTGFINRDKYIELGGITLEIKNIEDWPLRLLFTKNGEKIYVLKKYTILYRIGNSVSHSNNQIYNIKHIKQTEDLKKLLIYPNISCFHLMYYFNEWLNSVRINIIVKVFKNRKTNFTYTINRFLMLFDMTKLVKGIYNLIYH